MVSWKKYYSHFSLFFHIFSIYFLRKSTFIVYLRLCLVTPTNASLALGWSVETCGSVNYLYAFTWVAQLCLAVPFSISKYSPKRKKFEARSSWKGEACKVSRSTPYREVTSRTKKPDVEQRKSVKKWPKGDWLTGWLAGQLTKVASN